MTKSKRRRTKETDRAEQETAEAVDDLVCYLECSDFRPVIVKSFFAPLITSVDAVAATLADNAHMSRPLAEPIGVFGFPAHSRPTGRQDKPITENVICQPLPRSAIAVPFAARWADGLGPSLGRCRVFRSYIYRDGGVVYSPPRTYSLYDPENKSKLGEVQNGKRPVQWFQETGTGGIDTGQTYRRVSGSQWTEFHKTTNDSLAIMPVLAVGMLAARETSWAVLIGAENGLSELELFSGEDGVCDFYRLRDGPMAGGRRAALRHFVESYTRRPKNTPVREHFRGKEEFDWFGLRCRVRPPQELSGRVG